jgi:lipoprotein-anchoring transpeptidase ErfK/SrfK
VISASGAFQLPQFTNQTGGSSIYRRVVVLTALTLPLLGACQNADSSTPSLPPENAALTGARTQFTEPQTLRLPEFGPEGRTIHSLLNVPRRMSFGEFAWEAKGVAPGRIWMLVDLEAQTMSVFQGSNEIATTVLLFGMDKKPTPTGRFPIKFKDADYWSRTYDAPMPYALMLTDDGVAIHASEVEPGAATHGCIGVPVDFARRLFAVAKVGDEVVVSRSLRSTAV